MQYLKTVSTFLDFRSNKRQEAGVSYFSRDLRLAESRIVLRTIADGKTTEVCLLLEGPELLDFKTEPSAANEQMPAIAGRFLDSRYEENIFSATVPEKNLKIIGVVTKSSDRNLISTKTVTNLDTGQVGAVMQERIEPISEAEFLAGTAPKP